MTNMNDDIEVELSTESYNIEAMQELKKALRTRLKNRASAKNVIISKQDEGIRITRKALDTDWIITREILPEATELCNLHKDSNFMLFVECEQKTMGLVLRMKKQWPQEFSHIYVGTLDLHLRKCMLIFKRYGSVGLQHLTFLAGYKSAEQWKYLVDVSSIPKSYAFAERSFYTLQLCLCYEFLKSLTQEERKDVLGFIEQESNNIHDNQHFKDFLRRGNEDLVWKKLRASKTTGKHYNAE